MPDWLWYPLPFIPFIPFITRGILSLRFRPKMSETLAEDENDRENHRTLIMALAGFSFAALLAIAVLDTTTQRFRLPTYYLLISFLSYYFALNLQGYKFARWHDQLGDALVEAASLSLILAVITVVWATYANEPFAWFVIILALAVWLVDHVIRLWLSARYLRAGEAHEERQGNPPQPREE